MLSLFALRRRVPDLRTQIRRRDPGVEPAMADDEEQYGLFMEDGLDVEEGANSVWQMASRECKAEQAGGKGKATTKSGNSGASGSRTTKGDGEGKEKKSCKCDICLKMFAPSAMAMNSPYCHDHKRALDRISKMSKQQNQQEWWQALRGHKEKNRLRKVVLHFCDKCPAGASGKRNPYSLATLRTWYETKVAVAVIARGTMMNWERYEAWAKTPEGGGLTRSEAEAKWKGWEEDVEVLRDRKGPSKDALRLRVPTADDVDIISEYAQGSRQELHVKDVRKPDEQAIEKQRRQMFALQNSSQDQDMTGIGAGMLANLAGSTSVATSAELFGTVSIGDVTKLEADEDEDEEENADKHKKKDGKSKAADRTEVGEGNEEDEDDDGDSNQAAVKVKPFDAELTLGKARRKADDVANILKQQVTGAAFKAEVALNKVQAMASDEAAKYTHETDALRCRLKVLRIVENNKSDQLSGILADVAAGKAPHPCGTSDTDKSLCSNLGCLSAIEDYVSGNFTATALISQAAVCL